MKIGKYILENPVRLNFNEIFFTKTDFKITTNIPPFKSENDPTKNVLLNLLKYVNTEAKKDKTICDILFN